MSKEQTIEPRSQVSRKEYVINCFLSIEADVVGTQKDHFNETILLSTQITCLNRSVRESLSFFAKNPQVRLFLIKVF